MSHVSVKINATEFGKKFQKMLDLPKFKNGAYNLMEKRFDKARMRLMTKFNSHKVTLEIEAGPEAENTSGLLSGYGNLFSFIGFYNGDEPIANLRDYLEYNIDLRQTVRRGNNWYFRVGCPSDSNIEEVTPMNFEKGNSWVDGIEHGISNLSYYINTHWAKGRSEEGIQVKGEYRPDAIFETTEYLPTMLKEFREKFGA
jgi:hypothetical protein